MQINPTIQKLILGISILITISCANQNPEPIENLTRSPFEWDFSKQRKFVYSFAQTAKFESTTSKGGNMNQSYISGKGELNVKVKENKLADLSILNLQLKSVQFDEDGAAMDTTTQVMPANVAQNMQAKGAFSNTDTDLLFDVLVPLPKKDLKVGESDEIPMKMPLNTDGHRLFVNGQNTLKFKGFDDLQGRKCAVLSGDIDISNFELPEELTGEYNCSTTGKSTYYFDIENGYYVGADIQLLMKIKIDSESTEEGGRDNYMDMTSSNTFKIRLEKIEELVSTKIHPKVPL